jgi:hypothetical protein
MKAKCVTALMSRMKLKDNESKMCDCFDEQNEIGIVRECLRTLVVLLFVLNDDAAFSE